MSMDSFLPICPNIRKIDINKLGWSLTDFKDTLVIVSLYQLQVIRNFNIFNLKEFIIFETIINN